MLLTIHLPVSKPIHKFLTSKFGDEYQPNNNEWFGILISSLLERKSTYEYVPQKRDNAATEKFRINIKISYSEKHGVFFTRNHENLIRKAIESLFREMLYEQAILNKRCYGIDYKTSIENALEFYGVDVSEKSYLQAITRDFNRKKEAIENRLDKI